MEEMKRNCEYLSSEERRKMDFLEKVEAVMQGLGKEKVAIAEAYDQLLKLMGDQEVGQVLQLMHQRAMNILKDPKAELQKRLEA